MVEPSVEVMNELVRVLESSRSAQIKVGLAEAYLIMQACQIMLTLPQERLNATLREAYEKIGRGYMRAMEGEVSSEFLSFCELGWHREADAE